ncbi:MAG TPA: ATP-binding protein [Bryobacteraceae bacterium]|nr:ATP-binding protein [Bryobacteraceae bacterium]
MIARARSALFVSLFAITAALVALLLSVLLRPLIGPGLFALLVGVLLFGAWYAAWRRSGQSTSEVLSGIGDAVVTTDARGRITFFSPVAELVTGWRQADAQRRPLAGVLQLIDEHTRETSGDPAEQVLREETAVALPPHTLLVSKDGTEIPVEGNAGPIRDARGRIRGVILLMRDVTGRRQHDEQLSHSEKMEAVGRLAAGMAGDFNNVLTVIAGYSDLLRAELGESNPLRRFADEIMYAAERAATLTNRLLAFSRGQAAEPKLLDLNALLDSMAPMLRRLLGETIELILLPGIRLGKVFADPSQMEQVILNLATNARDAMPDGGKLVLETANVDLEDAGRKADVPAGSYVMLAVSDTGVGMDPATRSRLFEPFFTTKEQGKGSGLGLSLVYGIVKQSGGDITVYSQINCGTIFEIYLPKATEPAVVPAARVSAISKGSETLLLVDNEEGVRKLLAAVLRSNGYGVIEANNGAAALAAYEKNAHKIDLVLTDVVMPQMDGFELARCLAEKKNGVRILFMSGYRDNPIGVSAGVPTRAFLQKPFTPAVLLSKVREVLDSPLP